MQNAMCPVCDEPAAFIPDGWTADVIHTARGHVVHTHRPRPAHTIPSSPDDSPADTVQ